MSKAFASKGDLDPKTVSFTRLADNAYAYTAEGDPNTGVIIGDDCVMVIDAQATPVMAQDVVRHIRTVTDKPIRHVVLSHYHAVRVLGASGYGAQNIIASRDTYDLIVERGQQDYQSEFERFPRLFQAVETIPGLTWPTIVFERELTIWLGQTEVRLLQLGRGHTKGDTVAWMPKEGVMFSGDPAERSTTSFRFFHDAGRQGAATDAAVLPDGRLVIIYRKLGLWPIFTTSIAIADPSKLKSGAMLTSTTIAVVKDRRLAENYEGVAVQQDKGGLSLWLVSDDNLQDWQHSRLVRFHIDPAALRPSGLRPAKRAAPEPARP